ncbi:hypothetical protein GUJ93_ZPchr0001g30790 [Zizania palustris]|uniref:Glycerol-3-phosphate dehydrogenase NAD-dependent N-terminal domain-containing protein n=1 Tax=Zizania palustris TaxID=103762 RepID=A0A8J5RWS6_ZIZPA|nr:hypothetical protein GUJ93_ZPchr0001g30790 [Zizania palustris]
MVFFVQLRIVGVGAGAWGSVFCALLQDAYGHLRDKVQVRIWRRPGRAVDRATAEHLFEVINAREDVLRRLIRRCAYLKYVEARLGDRTVYADEILKDGFCLNMIDTPLCPLKVVTNLQEAVWDADIVINGLPSTETRDVFGEIWRYWKERITAPIIISLAKGIEASLDPLPRIITPTQMISKASEVCILFKLKPKDRVCWKVPFDNLKGSLNFKVIFLNPFAELLISMEHGTVILSYPFLCRVHSVTKHGFPEENSSQENHPGC